ncbi:platelet endothelial cell adhesion molecule isoform X2 [Anoplopoma fimbria]|uniref:platelet endothelial cell adhesion molecule isoform X2 n=1 Tax=Anoplopoma fimbria TaxID=229290 RepID=UPI0023EC91E6|nr:platelet endothelial cell adhesion molecule isoform X2 [Anoplopoma fimbria]
MILLLLLTSTLLSSYFHPGRVVDAQSTFTIRTINLSIEPSNDVTRDTNVTLRCQATVWSNVPGALSRKYTIYKDGNAIHTKSCSTSEDLVYPLSEVRVSNYGKYTCKINIKEEQLTSVAKKLTVTGQSKPVIHLNKNEVSEGEAITARCTAPGETGSIFFYFYKDATEIMEKQANSSHAEVQLHVSSVGKHKIHCTYTVLVTPESFKSEESNTLTVSVTELPITAVLEILPQSRIYEGDQLYISCSIRSGMRGFQNTDVYLSQGDQLLSSGHTKVNHSKVALAKDPGKFECTLHMGKVRKSDTKTISVTELFSVPTLTVSPAEVFHREYMTLSCKSESSASERLARGELTYTLEPLGNRLINKGPGIFSGNTPPNDLNYTCVARAKGIMKHSETLTIRPKTSVSSPKISVVGRAVLGQPFKILCQSDNGSLPINYTLLWGYDQLNTTVVKQPSQQALFTVSITKPDEISKYMCEAKNRHKEALRSRRLNATVIVPLTSPFLTVIPDLPEISEGVDLILICGVQGTPPVTFKFYRVGNDLPLYTTTSNRNHTDYPVHGLSKEQSGIYYCEAVNHARNVVYSDPVTIEVRMALWKKVVIGGFCLLALSVLAVVCVLCFRSKRVRLDGAAVSVWSDRPPEAVNDEESSVMSNEPDVEYTEVVHPRPVDPAKVPLRKGTETVYSELQNSPHGAADHHDYGSVEYAELNSEQPEINSYRLEVNNHQDLPVPVD